MSYNFTAFHSNRSANYSKPGAYVKCFHKTAKVKTLHNHYPFRYNNKSVRCDQSIYYVCWIVDNCSCLGACHALNVPERLGHLQHYRAGCVGELRGRCKEMFKDRTRVERAMWKFKAAVEQRSKPFASFVMFPLTFDSSAELGPF